MGSGGTLRLHRVHKFADQTAVPVMREVHDIGSAAGATFGLNFNRGFSADKVDSQVPTFQDGCALGADDLDAFGMRSHC